MRLAAVDGDQLPVNRLNGIMTALIRVGRGGESSKKLDGFGPKLNLVLASARMKTEQGRTSIDYVPADGAGECGVK